VAYASGLRGRIRRRARITATKVMMKKTLFISMMGKFRWRWSKMRKTMFRDKLS
jgi:hypothetical protein